MSTTSHGSCSSTIAQSHEDTEDANAHLFISYRDLYFDEQVRREEKLATAGTRLKERLATLAQRKEQRRTILDPRLGLDRRKKRRVGPVQNVHWSQREYRPKTLAEKARIKAGTIAFAYDPPRATRLGISTTRYAIDSSAGQQTIAPNRPSYIEEELEPGRRPSSAVKQSFAPASNSNFRATCAATSSGGTRFTQRTVTVPVKSSIDRPYRMLGGKLALASSKPTLPQTSPPSSDTDSGALSPPAQLPRRDIPGIRRKPMPIKPSESMMSPPLSDYSANSPPPPTFETSGADGHSAAIQSCVEPVTSYRAAAQLPRAYSPQQIARVSVHHESAASPPPSTSLPMLAPPKRPSMPSLFIPRKRNKPS